MAQITCEYCGTEYENDMQQCPLCGTPNETYIPEAEPAPRSGGKRGGARAAPDKTVMPRWLAVAVSCVLGAAVIIGAIYTMIALDIFGGKSGEADQTLSLPIAGEDERDTPEQPETPEAPAPAGPESLSCTSLSVSPSTLILSSLGETYAFDTDVLPAGCTEPVTWVSSNPSVCSVDASGVVTAFSEGSVTITAACGAMTATISVACNFSGALGLNFSDVTLESRDQTVDLRVENVPEGTQVVWSSSDESICTVEDGRVTAVDGGTATVTAELAGETVDCIVRCNFEHEGVDSDDETAENAGNRLDHEDVTLKVGESFEISVVGGRSGGWSVTNGNVISVDANGNVTGLKSGTAYVYTTVNGERLECVVRVK